MMQLDNNLKNQIKSTTEGLWRQKKLSLTIMTSVLVFKKMCLLSFLT